MKQLLTLLFLLTAAVTLAQINLNPLYHRSPMVLDSGDISLLKKEKQVRLAFDYTGMEIENFGTEQAYIDHRINQLEGEGKGKGAQWLKKWKDAQQGEFAVNFEWLVNKHLKRKILFSPFYNKAKYTLRVHTRWIHPGSANISAQIPAYISIDYTIEENTDAKKVLAKLHCYGILGMKAAGHDYEAIDRIAEAYMKAGKEIGQYLETNTK